VAILQQRRRRVGQLELARQLRRSGIRINAIATTITANTRAYERCRGRAANPDHPLALAFSKLESRAPFGRLNVPKDLAELSLTLARRTRTS
jgi:2-hydroxycyclohexanecarboxyl-CoA dehydrogenase